MRTDNSFNFKINLKELEGDVVRCAVKKVRYPAPATYTARRLFFADGNTFFNSGIGGANDYNTLFAKYGLNNFMYMYYPFRNIYMRLFWNNTTSAIVRQTIFSVSLDGVNWSAGGNLSNFGMVINTDWSGTALVPFDFLEIDVATLPVGTNLQNIHCPELRASMSYDTTTKTTTDIITNIVRDADFNPYVVNDNSYKIKEQELCHELSGNGLRALTDLNIYFSRVATPYVREPVVMPWSLELNFFNDA
jgi:hypothetical protein